MMEGGSCTGSGMVPSMGSLEAAEPLEGGSHASSSRELVCGDGEAHRTHHLLKHCLSSNQKVEALQQFNTTDVKEAAKDISRMGQRELQSKFKVRQDGGMGSSFASGPRAGLLTCPTKALFLL